MCIIIKPKFLKLKIKSINLSWLAVENATTFFRSNQPIAKVLDKNEVNSLNTIKIIKILVFKTIENFTAKNTLATTIVDECKSDDTGVGLSMAIGSHQLKIKSEDFLKIDKIKIKIIV